MQNILLPELIHYVRIYIQTYGKIILDYVDFSRARLFPFYKRDLSGLQNDLEINLNLFKDIEKKQQHKINWTSLRGPLLFDSKETPLYQRYSLSEWTEVIWSKPNHFYWNNHDNALDGYEFLFIFLIELLGGWAFLPLAFAVKSKKQKKVKKSGLLLVLFIIMISCSLLLLFYYILNFLYEPLYASQNRLDKYFIKKFENFLFPLVEERNFILEQLNF